MWGTSRGSCGGSRIPSGCKSWIGMVFGQDGICLRSLFGSFGRGGGRPSQLCNPILELPVSVGEEGVMDLRNQKDRDAVGLVTSFWTSSMERLFVVAFLGKSHDQCSVLVLFHWFQTTRRIDPNRLHSRPPWPTRNRHKSLPIHRDAQSTNPRPFESLLLSTRFNTFE
jgi:hypothetical protein